MAAISLTDITDGAITGNGVFDKLQAAGEAHLLNEYTAGRISGKDYATVYLGMLQSSMTQAIQFVLGQQLADKQADLVAQKILTEIAQTVDATGGTAKRQQDLILAQTDGFARNAEQQVLKTILDMYVVQRSTDSTLAPPGGAQADDMFAVITKACAGIGITVGTGADQIDNTA